MKIKIKEAYLLVLIVTGLMFTAIYSTYALFTKEVTLDNVVSFNTTISLSDSNLIEYELVTLNPNESKKIELRINNSSSSTLYYGCWYELLTNNASISIGQDVDTLVNGVITTTGTISTSENKTIVIGITNNGSSTVLVNLGVVGNTTSNLGLSSGRNIITDSWQDAIIVDDAYLNDHTTSTTETTNDEYTEAKMTQITLKAGSYLLQAWGAQGGNYNTYLGGKGGYSKGTITLTEDTTAFVYVGGQPATVSTDRTVVAGGFNGGGNGYNRWYSGTYTYGQGGGGASDIRIGTDSLYARVIVAGGGGGSASADGTSMYGGGTTGGSSQSGYGASQTSAGTNGSFGQGGSATTSRNNYKYGSGGGGGGWYGGGAYNTADDTNTSNRQKSGGGSGYVYTSDTASNCPSGCLLNSTYYLTDAATYGGNTSFTDFNGSTVTGRSGNGAVKITGSKTTTSVSIPTISGLSNLNVALGSSVSLEKDVTYSCESTSSNCTYLGANLTDTSSLDIGTHTIYYSIKASDNTTYKYARTINVTEGLVVTPTMVEESKTTTTDATNLEYTNPQKYEVTLSPGTYVLEAWGAQGKDQTETYYDSDDEDDEGTTFNCYGGKGGYSKGTLTLTENTVAYIYPGGQGSLDNQVTSGSNTYYSGGFNGGGSGVSMYTPGGGGSDIRLGTDSFYARVIVAGGGGGCGLTYNSKWYYTGNGGAGGGTSGGDGKSIHWGVNSSFKSYSGGSGGSQTGGGSAGKGDDTDKNNSTSRGEFGNGGNGTRNQSGGGGGWYGGGSGYKSSSGGGSGYVYTTDTASNCPSGCLLNSNYYLTDAVTTVGDQSITDFDGTTVTGHSGNGAVKITGTATITKYSIPVIKGLKNLTVLVSEPKSLTEGITYECENGGNSCTYIGPDVTNTSSLSLGTHTVTYKIRSASNVLYLYQITVKVVNEYPANAPALTDALIPVTYNESTSKWVKADSSNSNNSWYDYSNKIWANAVLVSSTNRSTYQSASAGTAIADADILAFYVWIPRYKYKVWNINKVIGTQSYNAQTTGIDIVFEAGTSSTGTINCTYSYAAPSSTAGSPNETCTGSNGDYYTHPAFTFGNQELTGFWMGKFELSSETPSASYGGGETISLAPRIIPNVASWRYNYVSNFWKVIYDMQKASNIYGLPTSRINADSHMLTNMEWGAVAYLTNSKYGRCTNGSCEKVTINNCSTGITGIGANSISTSESSTTCTTAVNKYNGEKGMLASTTGNIYGVYDMSGGSFDYVMGNMTSTSGTTYTYYAESAGTNFTYSTDTAKYLTPYAYGTTYTDQTAYNRGRLGDATGELVIEEQHGWNNSTASFSAYTQAWFLRGENFYGTGADIFSFSSFSGYIIQSSSTRAALIVSN